MENINYSDFEKVQIRLGKIIQAEIFPEARKPAYKLKIDLGEEFGIKNSSVQITQNYKVDELVGKYVMCCINLGDKQIGPFVSECLTLGIPDKDGNVVLISPTKLENLNLGAKLF